jgi:hypothetical protein
LGYRTLECALTIGTRSAQSITRLRIARGRQWLAQDNPERKTNAILSRPLRCTWRSLGTQLVPVTGPINRSGPYKISGAVLLVCGEKGVKRGTGLHFISNPPPPLLPISDLPAIFWRSSFVRSRLREDRPIYITGITRQILSRPGFGSKSRTILCNAFAIALLRLNNLTRSNGYSDR